MTSLWGRLVTGVRAGVKAFREAGVSSDLFDQKDFSDFDSRRLRYAMYWGFLENTAYRDIHTWARKMRADYGMYKYVRNIYNPSYRLASFWRQHLMGGQLDPAAGDGTTVPSALPIITANDDLRPAIAQVWRWSNWQIKKGVFSLRGASLGDVALQVVDDRLRNKVYLQVIHPGIIQDVTLDPFGNVKGYVIQEKRTHPQTGRDVIYTEIAERDGDLVVYRTLADGAPYAWNGEQSEWVEPYGFVPMVLVQHNDVGMEWGWSELHPGLSKIREIDDIASKLGDQIRKAVDSPWLFAGVGKADSSPTITGADSSTTRPEPGREEVPALYAKDPNAKAQALVAPLDMVAVCGHISSLLAELERDYPELQMDIWSAAGDSSGKALRIARQRVAGKVNERRPTYDDALVRAQQMALAIGGYRSLPGFEGLDLGSYGAGKLDHHIGQRPVFEVDPLDDLETEGVFWTNAKTAKEAGLPLTTFLMEQGWDEERMKRLMASPEWQARMSLMQMGMGGGDGEESDG
jgi:hypothetical protein